MNRCHHDDWVKKIGCFEILSLLDKISLLYKCHNAKTSFPFIHITSDN